jgi:hypothetical protein
MTVPSEIIVSVTTFAAYDSIRVCWKHIGLRPWRRSWRTGWRAGEGGGVVGGAGGGVGGPAGDSAGTINSAGVGNEGCEDVGSDGGENVGAESLSIGVGGAGESGDLRAWEMGDRSISSSALLSRSSSTLHLRLAAFRVRFAGGKATVAGDGSSGGVEVRRGGVVRADAPWTG